MDCYSRLQETEQRRIARALEVHDMLARQLNYIGSMIEVGLGTPGLVPRYQIRQPPAMLTGPVMQNINIQDNAIGVLNTGTVQHLETTIGAIRQVGNEELANALKAFVEVAANDESLANDDKRELVEGVDVVLQEAMVPREQQRHGLIRTVISRIGELAGTVTAVATAWDHLEPLLRRSFPFLF